MNLTKKKVKTEVETTETVCEITQAEFDKICAKFAADIVMAFMGDKPEADDVMAGLQLTAILAEFTSKLDKELFDETKTNKNPDTKEEK
jgi:hypothetical protein